MDWTDLLTALSLVLILEGMVLFASPDGLRRTWAMLARLRDGQLRFGGLLGAVVGLLMLYWIRF